ncbi:hypothetical protein EDD86DRAFT_111502 [Gorgonomyces haynaldii]|nr:hypothetical protein EDD86DRAFT_111502 [Gorgonomyces haynaldii]
MSCIVLSLTTIKQHAFFPDTCHTLGSLDLLLLFFDCLWLTTRSLHVICHLFPFLLLLFQSCHFLKCNLFIHLSLLVLFHRLFLDFHFDLLGLFLLLFLFQECCLFRWQQIQSLWCFLWQGKYFKCKVHVS